jgi:predicted enzyme related to lactoylglutathione lyase
MAEGGAPVDDTAKGISIVREVERRLRERPKPFRYITMDGDGEVTGVAERPPAPPGEVNCVVVMLARPDGSFTDPGPADIEAAIARYVQRGGAIRCQRDSDD